MAAEDLIRELGYDRSPNFLRPDHFGQIPAYSYLFQRPERTCRLQGVYTLKEGPSNSDAATIPLVYVCQADGDDAAALVHRRVWNQNVVPFILVETPSHVRLYSGFRYDRAESAYPDESLQTGILKAVTAFNRVAAELAGFRAEAIDRGDLWRDWEQTLDPRTRVDGQLLDSLDRLGSWLRGNRLPKDVTHALIGKYVYLRYLRDRNIL